MLPKLTCTLCHEFFNGQSALSMHTKHMHKNAWHGTKKQQRLNGAIVASFGTATAAITLTPTPASTPSRNPIRENLLAAARKLREQMLAIDTALRAFPE
jgi:hypothetical protein